MLRDDLFSHPQGTPWDDREFSDRAELGRMG